MREIKFRAWDKRLNRMDEIDGYDLYLADGKVFEVSEGSRFYQTYLDRQDVTEHFEIMQYTGLKDKNGKEIYEGDVVRFPDAYMNCNEDGDWDETVSTGQIKWDDEQAQFYATERESVDNCDFWENIVEAEVIGNIYEHPELLK